MSSEPKVTKNISLPVGLVFAAQEIAQREKIPFSEACTILMRHGLVHFQETLKTLSTEDREKLR